MIVNILTVVSSIFLKNANEDSNYVFVGHCQLFAHISFKYLE